MLYIVFRSPDPAGDLIEIGQYRTILAARRAAKQAVAGERGATECGEPACAGSPALESYSDRDGDEDSPIAWIEHLSASNAYAGIPIAWIEFPTLDEGENQ